jgi:hypothetical protein
MPPPCSDVEAATLAPNGSPPITRITLPTCRAHYPGGSSGCSCRLLPRSRGLPQMAGGSASALSLSRPAQASLALRPAGSLSCPRQPLSRGSSRNLELGVGTISDSFSLVFEAHVRSSAGWLRGALVGALEWRSTLPAQQSDACAGAPKRLPRDRLSLADLSFSGYPVLTFS